MGRSLLPKFPKDQDERLWLYIRMQLLGTKNSELPDPLIAHHRSIETSNGGLNGHLGKDKISSTVNARIVQSLLHVHFTDTNDEDEIDDVEEEEEIDDDEDNALRRQRSYRSHRYGNAIIVSQ